jgi:hypothetical protein
MVQIGNNPEKMWLELRIEEGDSDESTKSDEEVEQPTPVVRRSKQVIKPIKR